MAKPFILGSTLAQRIGNGAPPSRTFSGRLYYDGTCTKFVAASRRNRHAGRVGSPNAECAELEMRPMPPMIELFA